MGYLFVVLLLSNKVFTRSLITGRGHFRPKGEVDEVKCSLTHSLSLSSTCQVSRVGPTAAVTPTNSPTSSSSHTVRPVLRKGCGLARSHSRMTRSGPDPEPDRPVGRGPAGEKPGAKLRHRPDRAHTPPAYCRLYLPGTRTVRALVPPPPSHVLSLHVLLTSHAHRPPCLYQSTFFFFGETQMHC